MAAKKLQHSRAGSTSAPTTRPSTAIFRAPRSCPGAALLAEVLETVRGDAALSAAAGAQPQLGVVKFLGLVAPGTTLTIACRLGPRTLAWQVDDGTRSVASGELARSDVAAAAP